MRRIALLAMLCAGLASTHAANLTIPRFHLLTRGASDGGLFVLQTQADIDIQMGGGYKFGGQLSLSLASSNLEEPSEPGPVYDQATIAAALRNRLGLRSASVIVRDLFGLPLDASYFVGEHSRLVNGDIFPTQFGTTIVASDVRGLLYFPTGVAYNGLHAIDGTGILLSSPGLAPWLFVDAALYQDAYLGPGYYSTDVRAALNFSRFKVETFVGASFPQAAWGLYRGGLLLFYSTGQGGEFLTQIGVPRWAPVTDGELNIDDFYILFEPRVHIGLISIVLTLFWHPEYYVQAPTNDRGATDIIMRFIAGDVQTNSVSGGLESAIRLRPSDATDQLRVSVSPFVSISTSGVLWDMKANFNVFPFALDSLFEAYVGVRTEF